MEKQVHFFNHRNEKLFGTLHRPEKPSDMGIIMGHCFTCSRHTRVLQHISRNLTKAQFMVLRFDFSGNGQSEGSFAESSYTKHVAEIKQAMTFLSDNGAGWIGLAGHSMGAIISLIAAAQMKRVQAICVLAGRYSGMMATHFLSVEQNGELQRTGRVSFSSRGRSLELTRDFFVDVDRYDIPKLISTTSAQLLVIHGDQDEVVPVAEAHQAFRLNPKAVHLEIIPGADHMFSNDAHRGQIAELVAGWFTRQRSRIPN